MVLDLIRPNSQLTVQNGREQNARLEFVSYFLGEMKVGGYDLTCAKIIQRDSEWHIYYLDDNAFLSLES